jgi:hypothetical protein
MRTAAEVPLYEIVADQRRQLAEVLQDDDEGHIGGEAYRREEQDGPDTTDRFTELFDVRHVIHPTKVGSLVALLWVAFDAAEVRRFRSVNNSDRTMLKQGRSGGSAVRRSCRRENGLL